MITAIFQLVAFLAVLSILAFWGTRLVIWLPVLFITLAGLTAASGFSLMMGLLWLVSLVTAILLLLPKARLVLFTQPIFHWLRRRLPPLSETEKIALEAGEVWWEGELFSGKPDWQQLINLPKPQLSPEEQLFLENQTETLCSMINDWEIMQSGDIPPAIWEYIKSQGFWAMSIAKEHGGLGFSALAHSCVISKIASRSMSVAVIVMVPNSLGPAELLHHYGTDTQKQQYLSRLARGEEIPCFALTGVEIGSDATAMPDTGIVCYGEYNGVKTLGIRLNFDKRYITLAPMATVIGLAFKLFDPDKLLSSQTERGITVCLIPASHPGVHTGKRHAPLGLAFPNGPVTGQDVFVPLDWIIGGDAMIGQGWRMLMECLSVGRGISLPALSAGASSLSYRTTGAYAAIRRQFRVPIGQFEGVMALLARIGGFAYLIEATRLLTTTALDQGKKPAIVTAIAKYHLTEMARQSINDSMDIHAGRAVQTGPRNYLYTPYRGIPMSITVEGANILTRNLMIFGQGAIRCHRYLRKEMALLSAEETPDNLHEFDKLLLSHMAAAIQHKTRAFVYGITGGKIGRVPEAFAFCSDYYRQVNRMSAALAYVSDMTLLLLGGELKRREFLSARLGDVLSYLFLASAVMKYAVDNNINTPIRHPLKNSGEINYIHWTLQYCFYQIQIAFDQFFDNFPHKILGKMLKRLLVFPWGQAYHAPEDHLSARVAEDMLTRSALRERLGANCYVGKNTDDPVGRMEHALNLLLQAQPLLSKIKKLPGDFSQQITEALKTGIITDEEKALLMTYEAARIDAIQVDVF